MGDSALLTKKVEEGLQHEENNQIGNAIKAYEEVIHFTLKVPDELTDDNVKAKENAIYKLANIYKQKGLIDELITLQKQLLPVLIDIPKSKQAKIVRTLFDLTNKTEVNHKALIELCQYIIAWCEKESRSFLRMRIENKLAELYFKIDKFNDALEILKKLLYELKKKEDK